MLITWLNHKFCFVVSSLKYYLLIRNICKVLDPINTLPSRHPSSSLPKWSTNLNSIYRSPDSPLNHYVILIQANIIYVQQFLAIEVASRATKQKGYHICIINVNSIKILIKKFKINSKLKYLSKSLNIYRFHHPLIISIKYFMY
jgi:hypothetical protein